MARFRFKIGRELMKAKHPPTIDHMKLISNIYMLQQEFTYLESSEQIKLK